MTKEQIIRKIELLKEELSMQTEDSIAFNNLEAEIENLKEQLKTFHLTSTEH